MDADPSFQNTNLKLRRLPRNEHGRPVLGGIALESQLEQSPLGSVYFGRHPRLGIDVTVTMLSPTLVARAPHLVNAFFEEAQKVAQLQSPNIVRVLDVNTENDVCYLVEELVSGFSASGYLKKLNASGKPGMPEAEALMVVRGVTQGLVAAHGLGLLHLDIKPEHIVIPRHTGSEALQFGSAKLKKLGLSRLIAEAMEVRGQEGSALVGTLGYLAPELTMPIQKPTAAADVFEVGATLYALLSGSPPFQAKSIDSILLKTAHESPPDLALIRPDLSKAILGVIAKCLNKNPAERYQNANVLLEGCQALSVSVDTEPVGSRSRGRLSVADEDRRPRRRTSGQNVLPGEVRRRRTRSSEQRLPAAKRHQGEREQRPSRERIRKHTSGMLIPAERRVEPKSVGSAKDQRTRFYGYLIVGSFAAFLLLGFVLVLAFNSKEPEKGKKPETEVSDAAESKIQENNPHSKSSQTNPLQEALGRYLQTSSTKLKDASRNPAIYSELEGNLDSLEKMAPTNESWLISLNGQRRKLSDHAEESAKRLIDGLRKDIDKKITEKNYAAAHKLIMEFPNELSRTGASQQLLFIKRTLKDRAQEELARAEADAARYLKVQNPRLALAAFENLSGYPDPEIRAIVLAQRMEIKDIETRGPNPSAGRQLDLAPTQAFFAADIYCALAGVPEHFDRACQEAHFGKALQALSYCRSAIERYPRSSVLYYAQGVSQARLAMGKQAQWSLTQAKRHALSDSSFQSRLLSLESRIALQELGWSSSLTSCREKAKQALAVDPKNPDAHFMYGVAFACLAESEFLTDEERGAYLSICIKSLNAAHALNNRYPSIELAGSNSSPNTKDLYEYQGAGGNPSVPAVVEITATRGFGGNAGTGFIIKSDQQVAWAVTNFHVVENMKEFEINYRIKKQDGTLLKRRSRDVKLVAIDKENDLAILRFSCEEPTMTLSLRKTTSNLNEQMPLTVIGHPKGEDYTVISGELSNLNRASNGKRHLQLNANVTHGMSGGPVIVESGEVIGVIVGGREDIPGHCLAILSEHVRDLAASIGISVSLK